MLSHGWFQTAPFAWRSHDGRLERIERLGSRPVGVSVRQEEDDVVAHIDRALREPERAELTRRLGRMLQVDAGLEGFHDAIAFDAELREDLDRIGAGRLLAGTTLWEDAVKAICATNTSWRQTVATTARIASWDPDGAFPGPDVLLDRGARALRDDARVGYRAEFIVGAARMASSGALASLDAAATASEPSELISSLREIPGVGPASATFLAFLQGRYDVGAFVDSATRAAAARRWFDGRRPTDDEIRAVVEPAGRWAGLALYWATTRRWQESVGLA